MSDLPFDLESLFEAAEPRAPSSEVPAQGDVVVINGEMERVLDQGNILNYAGRSGAYVWKQRGCPSLPATESFCERPLELVGDADDDNDLYIWLPIDWPDQEGLDIQLAVTRSSFSFEVKSPDLHIQRARERRLLGLLARGLIYAGIDEDSEWMVKPAPTPKLLERGLEVAQIFLDELLQVSDDRDVVFRLADGTRVHRSWPVSGERFERVPDEIVLVENIVRIALGMEAERRIVRHVLGQIHDSVILGTEAIPENIVVPDLGTFDLPKLLGLRHD